MVLLGTVIMPHGAMPFDGDPNSEYSSCQKRHQQLDAAMKDNLSKLFHGMSEAAKRIAQLKPDLVILNSPHGICLSDSLCIYLNEHVDGNALWNDEWSEFSVSATIDIGRSQELKSLWESSGIPVQGLRSYGGLECKLRWGEVIPLWYLQKHMTTEAKYIITTNDIKPRTPTVEDWRLLAGKKLAEFVTQLPGKVVILISGDLAHFHPTDCKIPLYLPDPRSNMQVNKEESEAFEKEITAWIENPENKETSTPEVWNPNASLLHLSKAVKHDMNAYGCGMKGFVLLHGLLAQEVASGAKFTPKIHVHQVPTYYGMMAATFVKH